MSSNMSRESSKERTIGRKDSRSGTTRETTPQKTLKRGLSMKDKWQKTFKSVKHIGFKRFEEQLRHEKNLPEEDTEASESEGPSPKLSVDNLPVNFRGHVLIPLTQERLCAVCRELVGGSPTPELVGLKCDVCKISYHIRCEDDVRECKWSEEYARKLSKSGRASSASSERQSEEWATSKFMPPPDEIIAKAAEEQVDPVYYLLKQATNIRSKVGGQDPSRSPPVSNVPNIVTDTVGTSDLDFNASQCSTSAYSSASQLAPPSLHSVDQDHLSLSRYSAPSLSYLKSPSIDSQGSDYGSDTQQRQLPPKPRTTALRRPPNLNSAMKSLSLDSQDGVPYYPSRISPGAGYSPTHGRHLNASRRLHKHSSIDTDDTSNASGSPCLSASGSVTCLPHCQYVVLSEHKANVPEELSVRFGERVTVLEASDPVWWQVGRTDGRVGLVPAGCLHRIYNNERLIRVYQNLQLCEGNKSLRLYKDQIVFGFGDETNGNVKIRTDDDYRAKCPARYVAFLE